MPSNRLAGKVAVITGGTSGIGRAAAALFAQEGAHVVVASHDAAAGADTVAELGDAVSFVETDVTQPEQVRALIGAAVDRHGRLDVLYSNAGCNENGTAPETTLESWARVIAVNLSGPFYLAKYGLPALSRGGSVILTASELGLVGTGASVSYCAAKGGVVNMTRALAIDAAPAGIRVNCIAPGPTRTPMMEQWLGDADGREKRERMQIEPVPLQRMAEAREIAAAALFLASDDSSFMTGAVQVVDGGATSWYGF
jgi:meso-butanediol dehydrogenase/(S,S)-butanediol dehydrogenase/diacetyl reductase